MNRQALYSAFTVLLFGVSAVLSIYVAAWMISVVFAP